MESIPLKIEKFTYDIVYFVLWIIEITLFLRFAVKLLGGNPYNKIVMFLYSVSDALMWNFKDMFASSSINNMTLDPSTLIAMAFYAIVAYVIISLIGILSQRNHLSANRSDQNSTININ